MAAGYVLVGLVGLLAFFVMSAGSMTWMARAVGSALGIPNFRWFDPQPASAAWWRWLLVRVSSMAAPLVLSTTLFWASLYTGGVPSVTGTRVDVQAGPALAAGVRTGDRVLRVGDEPVRDFDELRAAVQRSRGVIAVEVERDGQRLVLEITPRGGRIGVSLLPGREQLSALSAARRALPMPFALVGSVAHELVRAPAHRAELRGPVGIVRETSAEQRSGNALLGILAALVGTWWPCAAAVVLFDIVTGRIFAAAHPETASASQRGWRLERLRQAAMFTCAGYATFLVAAGFDAAGVPFARLLLVGALMTGGAGYPLTWLGGREIWGRPSAGLVLLASMFAPCLLLFVVPAIHYRLGRALKSEGFRVTWLSAQPPAAPVE